MILAGCKTGIVAPGKSVLATATGRAAGDGKREESDFGLRRPIAHIKGSAL
ncbi:hypothetical protein [Massilia sp. 9096]|uniref:hypothetical protein n=1 Tax=Massilia sp. 9096 TaxID=1500894 RepID=UPI000AF512AD|nr:hypothetical protein [Massilia sp. 9096]